APGQGMDVIGISLGGLVARASAIPFPSDAEPALNIIRLFTLCTPHRGALAAEHVRLDDSLRKMRAGSGFLAVLNAALPAARYELIPYARTKDIFGGATRSAPPNQEPIWFEGPPLVAHHLAMFDKRIQIDIARRLRGEPSIAPAPSRPPRD